MLSTSWALAWLRLALRPTSARRDGSHSGCVAVMLMSDRCSTGLKGWLVLRYWFSPVATEASTRGIRPRRAISEDEPAASSVSRAARNSSE